MSTTTTTPLIHHKRGDTLNLSGDLVADDLTAQDLTGWTGRVDLRLADGTLVQALMFAWIDASQGTLAITATAADSATWPVGRLVLDVEFTRPDGSVLSSPTVVLFVSEDITL